MKAETLKKSILQLAVEGKLVPQIESEGTARELLERIKEEKEQLIKDKKIKRDKNESVIYRKNGHYYERVGKKEPVCIDDEIPFDIPDSWEWARLGNIVYNHGQKKPDTEFSYIDIGSINNEKQKLNDVENILSSNKAPSRARKIVKYEDILYSTVRPYLHNMCIIDSDFLAEPIASTGFAVMHCFEAIFVKYLFYYLLSPNFDNYVNDRDNSKGIAYPSINNTKLYKSIFPLPPLSEQHRIVEKIEELLPYIEKYDLAEQELTKLNEEFPEKMKKSILQYAVEGKLVPQIESEGTARELLERIKEEKEQLIKDKKIKRDKNESVIYRKNGHYYERVGKKEPVCIDDEIPFDIPDSWEWCRLGKLGTWGAGGTPSRSNREYYNGDIPWLKTGDLTNGYIKVIPESITEKALKETSVKLNPVGSILIAMYGATIGKLGILTFPATTNQACCACVPFEGLYNLYLFYYLMGIKNHFIKKGEGGAQPNISRTKIVNTLIPLPPLSEQHRIVERIEEILPLIEVL